MILTSEQNDMLKGGQGSTKQKAMRLLVDLGEAAGAKRLIPVTSAHVSGVSPLTGGEGLIRFLKDLTAEGDSKTAVETTLNSAGCDRSKIEEMDIPVKDYVEKQQNILDAYERLGIKLTLSCTPYDNLNIEGNASWAESNAVCFANSYTKLRTNRESGLSAIATAICGFTPEYGLLLDENRVPNLTVTVDCDLEEPVDYSILGDWIGKQIQPQWKMEYGVIPIIFGRKNLNSECRKALTAAAANYGCPMLFVDGFTDNPQGVDSHANLRFTAL
ncbi:MAG TPA: aconitase X, partial [Candidatus Poseidoniia archaeon]|nr:aconitase X [Candidatus Poseidoniia archaeon]